MFLEMAEDEDYNELSDIDLQSAQDKKENNE